jgi:hypothetical protein
VRLLDCGRAINLYSNMVDEMNIRNLADLERSCLGADAKEQIRPHLNAVKVSKYRNKIVTIDGRKFHSKKEARCYLELKAMEKAGAIKGFSCQVPFPVTDGNKPIKYFLDFLVQFNDNRLEHWDVKGMRTRLYILKKRLVEEKYGIEIIEK